MRTTSVLNTPLPNCAFQNRQLSLFQEFFANGDEREHVSNTIEFWDSVPRYSVSRQAMARMRDATGRLEILNVIFHCSGKPFKAAIRPARIDKIDYYPSAGEELVEEALRKIAAQQSNGFHEPAQRSGVVFTLYQLREELGKSGHARSYAEIVQSLDILNMASIEIRGGEKMKGFERSAYFPRLSAVSRSDYDQDHSARWYVQFHPMVTESIDKLSYRQFNYQQLMKHNTQLARWIHRQLILKYTFATITNHFEMRYSTIYRDSGILSNYSRERQARDACDDSVKELETQKILMRIVRKVELGARGKVLDVVYDLYPTPVFVREVKAANARKKRPIELSTSPLL
jgi:hypothetical protein